MKSWRGRRRAGCDAAPRTSLSCRRSRERVAGQAGGTVKSTDRSQRSVVADIPLAVTTISARISPRHAATWMLTGCGLWLCGARALLHLSATALVAGRHALHGQLAGSSSVCAAWPGGMAAAGVCGHGWIHRRRGCVHGVRGLGCDAVRIEGHVMGHRIDRGADGGTHECNKLRSALRFQMAVAGPCAGLARGLGAPCREAIATSWLTPPTESSRALLPPSP
jgi:hypothetical protein